MVILISRSDETYNHQKCSVRNIAIQTERFDLSITCFSILFVPSAISIDGHKCRVTFDPICRIQISKALQVIETSFNHTIIHGD